MVTHPVGSDVGPGRERAAAAARAFWVVLPVAVWAATTAAFWVGYVGSDDMFYSRYARLLHRPPMNWWEFRTPAVGAIRACFLAFGVSEFSAALPSLAGSVMIFASVAWFVGWPRDESWQARAAVLLAATLPLDVGYRSVPGATHQAAGLLALGTVCFLRGRGWVPYAGAWLLALAFLTHEVSFFYVAIFCFTLLGYDPGRFWRPVLACVAASGLLEAVECAAYTSVLGDPLARYHVGAAATSVEAVGRDLDMRADRAEFFLWPVRNLIFCKPFGPDLGLLLACGLAARRRLAGEQKILLTATFLVWGYLGYGTLVPFEYRPTFRQFHFYPALALGMCALLPAALAAAFPRPRWLAPGLAFALIGLHLTIDAASGGWGREVDVSRALLRYAQAHPGRTYATDVSSLNEMYVVNGFRLPENVICLNGPPVAKHLLVNKEPPGTPPVRFPDRPLDGLLVNRDRPADVAADPDFPRYAARHRRDGFATRVAPVRYRRLFAPLVPLIGVRDFMIKSRGGEAVELDTPLRPDPPTAAGNARKVRR